MKSLMTEFYKVLSVVVCYGKLNRETKNRVPGKAKSET